MSKTKTLSKTLCSILRSTQHPYHDSNAVIPITFTLLQHHFSFASSSHHPKHLLLLNNYTNDHSNESNQQIFKQQHIWFTVHGLNYNLNQYYIQKRYLSPAEPLIQQQQQSQNTSDENNRDSKEIEENSAEAVDRAIEDYDKLLDKQKSAYPPNYLSVSKRVKNALVYIYSFLKLSIKFTLGFPGMMYRGLVSPMDVKKKWFKKHWKHLKEGSYHYWVNLKL